MPDRRDPRFDVLRFGLDIDRAQGTASRLLRAFRTAPARSLRALGLFVIGKRLRARMRIRALLGDRIRMQRRQLDIRLASTPPSDWPLDEAPGLNARALQDSGDVLLVGASTCSWPEDAMDRARAFFARNPNIMVACPHSVATDVPGLGDVPLLLPGFNPEQWLEMPPGAPAFAVRSSWFAALGGLGIGIPGSEWADFLLRSADRAGPQAVGILDDVFVRWQARGADRPLCREDTRALEQARLAVAQAAIAADKEAKASLDPTGRIVVTRQLRVWPTVSLIIPTRDRLDLLRPCVQGILTETDYPDIELIIVDNGSSAPETIAYLDALQRDRHAIVLRDERAFNYSALNNLAARHARGSVLAFLNNDITILQPDWLKQLVGEAVRPEIGAVGATLLYPSGLVQHGGVVLGLDGLAGHAFQFFPENHAGYQHQLRLTRQVSAVTGACLVVTATKFEAVRGFDEEAFAVALNDVDLGLKLDQAGYRNLVMGQVRLVHHESATRASDRAPAEYKRWLAEKAAFTARWPMAVHADRWYPAHLGRRMADFALPQLRRI
jgi:GT2 family glycosyltransferase